MSDGSPPLVLRGVLGIKQARLIWAGRTDMKCCIFQSLFSFRCNGFALQIKVDVDTSGIADDKEAQKKSLQWIREQSTNTDCVESLANHDPDVKPHIIEL